MKKRKLPVRVCIGCQEPKNKRDLIRIVRTPEGNVEVDLTGKKAGRGTYICPSRSCLEAAVKGKRIDRSLKHPVSAAVIAELTESLPPGPDNNE